jgi:WD40 repeat protein
MDPELLRPIHVKRGGVNCVCILSDGKYAAAGSTLGTVLLFPIVANVEALRLTGHQDSVSCICPGSESRLITGSDDGTVRVWTDRQSATLQPNAGPIRCVSASPREPLVLVVGEDGPPSVWNARRGDLLATLAHHACAATCGALAQDGALCVTGAADGVCRLFDARTGKQLRAFKAADAVCCVALCAHAPLAAAGCADGYVTLFDYRQNEVLAEGQVHDGGVAALAFHPDAGCLLSGGADRTLRLVGLPRLRVAYTLEAHKDAVRSVAWAADGRLFVSGGDDRGVFVWRAPELRDFEEEEQAEEEDAPAADARGVHAEEEQGAAPPTPGGPAAPAAPAAARPRRRAVEAMRIILERVRQVEGVVAALEERVGKVDEMIELIERAQTEERLFVSRAKPKAKP